MREIKFRAWFDRGEDGVESLASHGNNPADQFGWIEEGQPIILEQFTGLHDKNGKEIYEGDIVQYHNSSPSVKAEYWEPIYRLFYEPTELAFEFIGKGMEPSSFLFALKHRQSCVEVIGNIHENPELREGLS